MVSEIREKLAALLLHDIPDRVPVESGKTVELFRALSEFVTMFELVFDLDWDVTQATLEEPEHFIAKGGTFIRPLVRDEGNNWMNRGSLLEAYRALLRSMEKRGVPALLSG